MNRIYGIGDEEELANDLQEEMKRMIPIEVLEKIRDEIKEDYTIWEGTEFGDGIKYCWRIIHRYMKEQE